MNTLVTHGWFINFMGSWLRMLRHHFNPQLVIVTQEVICLTPRQPIYNLYHLKRQMRFLTLVSLSSEPEISQNQGLRQMSQFIRWHSFINKFCPGFPDSILMVQIFYHYSWPHWNNFRGFILQDLGIMVSKITNKVLGIKDKSWSNAIKIR